jgi:23S rRNA (uracil1939-C5)-methyltransferase
MDRRFARLPQIELAVGDDASAAYVLVLRNLEPLASSARRRSSRSPSAWRAVLSATGRTRDGSTAAARPAGSRLRCRIRSGVPLLPTEFTQVNPAINHSRRTRDRDARSKPGDRVADLRIGNFTLPIARRGATVIGIEGNVCSCAGPRRSGAKCAIDSGSFRAQICSTQPRRHRDSGASTRYSSTRRAKGQSRRQGASGDGPPQQDRYVSCNPATLRAMRQYSSTTTDTRSKQPAS